MANVLERLGKRSQDRDYDDVAEKILALAQALREKGFPDELPPLSPDQLMNKMEECREGKYLSFQKLRALKSDIHQEPKVRQTADVLSYSVGLYDRDALAHLGLSMTVYFVLVRENKCRSISHLREFMKKSELKRLKKIGPARLKEIKTKLRHFDKLPEQKSGVKLP